MPTPYRDLIRYHARVAPGRTAVRQLGGRTLSYGQLDERIERLAAHLQAGGIARGDRVALLACNGSEYFELQHACGRIGAIAVLLNWRLTVPELAYILGDCTPRLLIHDITFAETAAALKDRCGLPALLALDAQDPASPYEQALAGARLPARHEAMTHDDISVLMYTSGTTGHPKGAIITHGMVFWNTVNVTFPCRIAIDAVQLVLLPLFHIGGLNSHANPLLHAGGTVVLQRAFDPAEALRVVGDPDFGITHMTGVPAQFQFMAAHADYAGTDVSRLRFVGMGGSPAPMATIEAWTSRGVPLVQGYGMTETSPGITSLDTQDLLRKPGSIGKPVPYTDVRLVGPDGVDVAPGEVGEFWVRGPNVTPGYWNRPDAAAQAFHEGWLKTGDAGRQDAEGFFYIVDRVKDMYISGGENVYPAEVENVLYQLPQVAEAAIVGVPHPRWGETGLAVVVRRPGTTLEAAEVLAHCNTRLARFKVPGEVAFVDQLPRTAAGKVLKRQLRERFAAAAPA
jgi:fatty-acyl-CoA synthase